MVGIFISYRQEDSWGQARLLHEELGKYVGKDSVFMDVASNPLGRDFRQNLDERLKSCEAMLALIGPKWLDIKDPTGRRRLDDPADYVRQEIATGLKRDITVTPVLLQGASMPPSKRLPDDLKDLPFREWIELSHKQFASGVAELARRLGLPDKETSTGWTGALGKVLNVLIEGQRRAASPATAPSTLSLARIIPGQWQLDITYPNGMSGQATALFEPSGIFRAEGRSRVATFTLSGTWRADSSDQVSLRGHQFDGVQTIPYNPHSPDDAII